MRTGIIQPLQFIRAMSLPIVITWLIVSSAYAQNGYVTTCGKQIISADGNPLMLKGTNLGNWLEPEGYMFKIKEANSPRLIYEVFDELIGQEKSKKFWEAYRSNYITRKDIEFIKGLGLNSVRVPFNFKLFVDEDKPSQWDSTGFQLLDSVVTWCREAGLWVILDMHCAPGGQTGDNIDDSYGYPFLFESEESQRLTVELWQKIADRYRDETTVIGFDLLNEPIAPYFDVEKINPLLEPLYKRITAAIREVDTNHLIFLGGAQWDSNFNVFGKPFDSKLVYTFHKYWSDTTQSVIQEYIDYREKYNVPVWLGESGENSDVWISSFRRLLEGNNIGWCFWPYKKLDASTCLASIKRTEAFDKIIEFANSDRSSFEKIRNKRPDSKIVENGLNEYLQDCLLENCVINDGYIKSLGLNSK
ncbi:MAG: glycoside hydrolase family 5 protein [Candidatus Kryptoniota bacterium]